jgi:hypothetical protein
MKCLQEDEMVGCARADGVARENRHEARLDGDKTLLMEQKNDRLNVLMMGSMRANCMYTKYKYRHTSISGAFATREVGPPLRESRAQSF